MNDDILEQVAEHNATAASHRRIIAVLDALDDSYRAHPSYIPEDQHFDGFRTPDRAGRCYELSLLWVMAHNFKLPHFQTNRLSIQLHHGSIEGPGLPRIGHAWISFRNEQRGFERWVYETVHGLFMPAVMWREFADARAVKTYDSRTASRTAIETSHYGPWHDSPFGLNDCPHGHPAPKCPHHCTERTLKEPT